MRTSEIIKAFGHRIIGTSYMKKMVALALKNLSNNINRKIIKSTWFIGSFDDGLAFTIRGDELKKGECLIFLSDELFQEDEGQIIWTITHEIGHVVLGHRNSIGRVQTRAEVRKQESEADGFAGKYIG